MRTVIKIYFLFAFFVLVGCSTALKVQSSWAEPEIKSMLSESNVLVIAKTKLTPARIEIENGIKKEFEAEGYNSVASYTRMPTLNPNQEVDELKVKAISEAILKEGFSIVVLTTLKNIDTETQSTTTGDYYLGGAYYRPHYRGFGNYYRAVNTYYTPGTYVPGETTTRDINTYELETVTYHLTPEGSKLLSVVSAKVKDPSNLDKAAQAYTKTIVGEILKTTR